MKKIMFAAMTAALLSGVAGAAPDSVDASTEAQNDLWFGMMQYTFETTDDAPATGRFDGMLTVGEFGRIKEICSKVGGATGITVGTYSANELLQGKCESLGVQIELGVAFDRLKK